MSDQPKHCDEPLGLPRGTVRAVITILLVGITAAVLFVPTKDGSDQVKAMFVLLTGIAVRDYFSHRQEADARHSAQESRELVGDVG
jgi:hypothetical protein